MFSGRAFCQPVNREKGRKGKGIKGAYFLNMDDGCCQLDSGSFSKFTKESKTKTAKMDVETLLAKELHDLSLLSPQIYFPKATHVSSTLVAPKPEIR